MPSRFSPFLRPILGLAAVTVALFLAGYGNAQPDGQLGDQKTVENPYTLKRGTIISLLRGNEVFDPKNNEHVQTMDINAKYMTYRFTWAQYNSPTSDKDVGKMDSIHKEIEDQIKLIKGNKSNQADIAKAYVAAMIPRLKEVLGNPKPIVRVNAARALAQLGILGQGELADALVDVLSSELKRPRAMASLTSEPDKRNDGVIYNALHGMNELLTVPNPMAPAPPVLTPEQENKLAGSLIEFITKAPKFPKDIAPEEFEGYRSMRREAIRALAHCRAPGLKDKSRPGMLLLRIAANDGISPEPRIDERIEAAIGVARMREAADGKEFQPEYAAFQLAQFVDALGSYYAADRNKKDKEARPFRIYAARLSEALEGLKVETKNDYVGKVVDQSRIPLQSLAEKGEIRTSDLTKWLNNNPAPKDSLFQGVADSTVKAPNRPAEGQ
jgi:hypothetical protein